MLTIQPKNHNPQIVCFKEIILYRRIVSMSVLSLFLVGLVFVFAPYIMVEAKATDSDVSVSANWSPISLELNPDYGVQPGTTDYGNVVFGSITPSTANGANVGTQRVVKKTLGVASSGKYYSVYLSMGSNTNKLVRQDSSDVKIDSVNGTWDSPAAFSQSGWGYAVPSGSAEAGTFETPFTANYSGAYDSHIGTDMTSETSGYNTGTWAAIPVIGSGQGQQPLPQQIWKATTTNDNGFGTHGGVTGDTVKDHFDIYYSTMVDTSVLAGEYSNTIVYTAIASSGSLDSTSNNVIRNKEFVGEGDIETLKFDLAMSPASIAQSSVKVYLIPHSVANSASYVVTSTIKTNVRNGDYEECTVGTFTISENNGATLTCEMPESAIETATTGGTHGQGSYDFIINVDGYDYWYLSKYTKNNSPIASVVYAGLQSVDESGNKFVTQMQDITPGVCNNTNMWGAGTGAGAKLYDYTGTGTPLYEASAGSVDQQFGADASGKNALGSFVLTDSRDSKKYLVRRLADGNCWMVQNLDLNLASFAGKKTAAQGALTPDNTDLTSETAVDRGYWDPTETVQAVMTEQGWDSFSQYATNKLGFAQLAQYTSGTQRNTNEAPEYTWGSIYKDDGTVSTSTNKTTTGISVENSKFAAIPRSYNNADFGKVSEAMSMETGAITSAAGSLTTRGASDPLLTNASYYDAAWTATNASNYVGDYYNWYAATAESGTYAKTSGVMEDSICPKGWRLPSNSVNGTTTSPTYETGSWSDLLYKKYHVLDTQGTQTDSNNPYNSATGPSLHMHMLPLSIPFTGYYAWVNGHLNDRGQRGNFWSSTPSSSTYARYLHFGSAYVHPQYGGGKVSGLPVRCVARQS